jgi:hypothetical protein
MARTSEDLGQDEVARLREQLERREREHLEQLAAAHAAVAAAEERSYWLDRWGIDLNALMRRPGASELRALVRAVRAVVRLAAKARARLRSELSD